MMKKLSLFSIVVVALAAFAWPEAVHACAVCFDASEENRQAFIATTAFLSLLPLGMVGGAGLWLRQRVRERDAQREGSEAEGPDVT